MFSLLGEKDAFKVAGYEFLDGDNAAKYSACIGGIQADWLNAEKQRLAQEYEKSKSVDCLKEIMKIEEKLREIKNGGG